MGSKVWVVGPRVQVTKLLPGQNVHLAVQLADRLSAEG